MFAVITEFSVAPESRDAFEDNFTASMQATLSDVPGLQRAQLLRPDTADRGYLAVMEFDDEAAYTAYTSSDAFHTAHGAQRQTHATDPRVNTYQTVTQIHG